MIIAENPQVIFHDSMLVLVKFLHIWPKILLRLYRIEFSALTRSSDDQAKGKFQPSRCLTLNLYNILLS